MTGLETTYQRYVSGLTAHRDGRVMCMECKRSVEYQALAHLDFYSDCVWLQCQECADKNGEYCGVSKKRGQPRDRIFRRDNPGEAEE